MTKGLLLWLTACVIMLSAPAGFLGAVDSQQQRSSPTPASAERALVSRYCVTCHNARTNTGGLALDIVAVDNVGGNVEVWEKALRKLRARAMPPAGAARPDDRTYDGFVSYLETELDRLARANPDPGRPDPFRRLNRTEYQNAIRDVLGLDVDVTDLLPRDDASFGFDNVSVAGLSPTLMERYLSAAQKISRLALGSPIRRPTSRVVVLPPDLTQEAHFDGLPLGTRGGVAVDHTFPLDGEYEIQVQLSRDRNENVEGLTEPHELEITLDGRRLKLFTITPNRNRMGAYYADEGVDKGLEVRIPVSSGPHVVGATFLQNNSALIETERQPYQSHFNMDRHPRVQPAVRTVSIEGPFNATGAGDTPSRRRILSCQPGAPAAEADCARKIIANLARRAYRRPVTDADLQPLLAFYRSASATDSSERSGAGPSGRQRREPSGVEGPPRVINNAGIEMALRALLSSTEFLFRIERDPAGLPPRTPYQLSDVALASRLSFFLWSSVPDEELLAAAERGDLKKPVVLERQVRRMIADPRAGALATNFAGQWLHLRNLAAASPDARLFPDFDENLRQAFRRETELLFESILEEDRNVTELLSASYTFLNERLAKHYGIPNVYGDRFRRVALGANSERAGVLGHGSVLTVTSYATRTSPVLRGKWILENILGTPPPPPPQNVPPLPDVKTDDKTLTMRERMAEHRANPTCAACHQLMDPAGLSMENFDAIGRWRTRGEGGSAIDASGSLPGGAKFDGVAGLRETLLARPDLFAGTLTEKLLTFALGRGVDYHDGPAVRQIVRDAARNDYRLSALILGVVNSGPFQMRRSADRPVSATVAVAR
jgi:hypothetical protein